MLRHSRGLRRTLAALAVVGVLMLPAVQLLHADMMSHMGLVPCDGSMAMPMSAAHQSPGQSQQPAPDADHHGCCCDSFCCSAEVALLPSALPLGLIPAAVASVRPSSRGPGAPAPQLTDHRLPYSLPPPSAI